MMGEVKGVEEGEGEKAGTPRPLRVRENLGLGMIQSSQGQPQPALRYGSRMPSESEYGILIERERGGAVGAFMSSSCRLISG